MTVIVDKRDRLTQNVRKKSQPLPFLIFVLRKVFCIEVPVINPVDDLTFAFVPSVHYLLRKERRFVDKVC